MWRCAAIAALLLGTTAAAQSTRMTERQCEQEFAEVAAALSLPPVGEESGWCVARNIRGDVSVETLQIRFARHPTADPTSLPHAAHVRMSGVTIADQEINALFKALFASDGPFDLDATYRTQPVSRKLMIQDATITAGGRNAVTINLTLEPFDLGSAAEISSSVGAAGLSEMGITLTSDGTLDIFPILEPLQHVMFGNPKHDRPLEVLRSAMAHSLDYYPDETLAHDDMQALGTYLRLAYDDAGVLNVKLNFDRRLTIPRIFALIGGQLENTHDMLGFLPDMSITADWAPAP